MDWYYANNGQQAGPVSEEELGELYRNGTVKPFDLVWNETLSEWTPIGKLEAFASAAPAPPALEPTPALAADTPPALHPAPPANNSAPVGAPQKTDATAITALVLGILSLLCCGIVTGIPAVICGHIGLAKFQKDPGLQGKGLAMAGLILGYVSIVFSILYLIYVIAFGGMSFIEETMRQIETTQP